jgi:hypothetical protein
MTMVSALAEIAAKTSMTVSVNFLKFGIKTPVTPKSVGSGGCILMM